MGPGRLRAVLDRWDPEEAWALVMAGRAHLDPAVAAACRPDPAGVGRVWRSAAAIAAPTLGSRWRAYEQAGVGVHVLGRPGYPPELATDHEAPAVLFSRGRPALVEGRRVALIGTRRCTRYGWEVAHELGRDLAAAGVRVVSGLALGVDGAAHAGALAAGCGPPVGVVGSGPDIVYPRRHASLWSAVATHGVVLGEAPLGAPPEAWRFPVRNRIIAALAEVVVVVESPLRGGSLHTLEAATARSRPVMAVPGPVRNPASALPNALLAEGCAPVRDALDVLVALDLADPARRPAKGHRPGAEERSAGDDRAPPDPEGTKVLDAVGWGAPASFEEVVVRTGLSPGEAGVALARLERDGWVSARAGWWERTGRP
jgi:DNA processing protein